MTIAIVASGPGAGLAVFKGLAAAEAVGSGSIGGFAVFCALDHDGREHRAETYRGGSRTLFIDGETTGVSPPEAPGRALLAAIISSGPDRPPPLADFIAADPATGLVTGHRLPNGLAVSGLPLNRDALSRLSDGATARDAVLATLTDNPDADVGLIALNRSGDTWAANSRRVAQRPDIGHARRQGPSGQVVEILHNAIAPIASLAALIADITLGVLAGPVTPLGRIVITSGTPVHHADQNQVVVDAIGKVREIRSSDRRLVTGRHVCAPVYLASQVVRDGRILGRTQFEPNGLVENGRLVRVNGQTSITIDYA